MLSPWALVRGNPARAKFVAENSQVNLMGALTTCVSFYSFFLKLIVNCILWVIYMREYNDSNVWVKITRPIVYGLHGPRCPMSAVWEKQLITHSFSSNRRIQLPWCQSWKATHHRGITHVLNIATQLLWGFPCCKRNIWWCLGFRRHQVIIELFNGLYHPGPTFIKPDQLDPWIKDQIKIILLPTISHLQLPNFVSCGRACPSHVTQNLVAVGANLWTAERFLDDPWSMDYADPFW